MTQITINLYRIDQQHTTVLPESKIDLNAFRGNTKGQKLGKPPGSTELTPVLQIRGFFVPLTGYQFHHAARQSARQIIHVPPREAAGAHELSVGLKDGCLVSRCSVERHRLENCAPPAVRIVTRWPPPALRRPVSCVVVKTRLSREGGRTAVSRLDHNTGSRRSTRLGVVKEEPRGMLRGSIGLRPPMP